MSCKQSELISAINSFTAAVTTNDPNLKAFSNTLLSTILEKIEFDPEDSENAEVPEEEAVTPEVV